MIFFSRRFAGLFARRHFPSACGAAFTRHAALLARADLRHAATLVRAIMSDGKIAARAARCSSQDAARCTLSPRRL